ncbi:cytochrome P450 [Ascodesmis nigricans]|uniref:Cytochrome P450 n=1 Tax=Ascodesmis nigricans TaxID=341454 RepID=A0A4S2MWT5_9PEZI|nr:cytochrome P450 [Ascodesmis nigricans]
MWSGPRPTVVIGDPQVAHDLLHLKPIIFGSRPRFVVMGELFAKNGLLLTMPYGPKFTATKRMMNMSLVARDLNAHAVQEAESKKLARDLINSGYSFERHINRYVASVMMCLAYGRRIDNMDDPVLEKIYQRARYMAQLNTAGRYWAETFPLLTWIPDFLAPWKREIKRNGAASSQMLYDLAKEAEEPIGYDRAAPKSFAKNLWEKKKHEPALNLNEWEIANAAGSLFNAGSDTSSATLQTFILAMTVFPEVAAKAQEEIDRVVGHDRVPTWEDRQNLPYCRAILKETLRWRPVAVLGGNPHCSTEDYHYRGHYIPKGTAVMGNLWAIHHNEEYFVDSHRFWPERYTEPEKVQAFCKPYPNPEGHSSFGWGVRACPGKGLAEDSLFISIVRILWGFNITKARDPATKEEITPSTFSYTTGFNTKPTPFPCVFTPRSDKHREILLQDASAADEFLKGYRTG